MNLFTQLENENRQEPLAQILRPKTLDEYLGQTNVISNNSPLLNLLKSKRLFSFIFFGPPGCGKTTLARLIANYTNARFVELSATSSGVKDIKDIVASAKENLIHNIKTILFIDEIHRYSKTQQDALLPHLESGLIYLIGSTTENPSFQVNSALLSRTSVIQLNKIDNESIKKIILKGFDYLKEKYGDVVYDDEIVNFIIRYANGDARSALNLVEKAYFSSSFEGETRVIKLDELETLAQKTNIKYSIQEHYDLASAFQKSLRGSDKNAAIYYLAKLIESGEDPRFISRRLIVTASEDVGNQDPNALNIAINAHKAVEILGLPEGRIPLAQAVIYIANAPKSNQTIMAIDEAINDIRSGKDYLPPMHLRDCHYKDAKKYGYGDGYFYSHLDYNHKQQFLPDEIKDRDYFKES